VLDACYLGVYYRISDPDYRAKDALGLKNPGVFLYETFPLSFVADWWFPIGAALRQMTAFTVLTFVDGYQSFKHSYDLNCSEYDGNPLVALYRKDTFEREVLTGFGDLAIDPLRFRNDLSLIRAADAVSLVYQLLKS
jgi:hypothetical protein